MLLLVFVGKGKVRWRAATATERRTLELTSCKSKSTVESRNGVDVSPFTTSPRERTEREEREAGSNSRNTLVTHVDHAAVLAPKHSPFSLCRGALCRVTSFCCAASHGSFFQPDAPRAACDLYRNQIKFYVVPRKTAAWWQWGDFFCCACARVVVSRRFWGWPAPRGTHARLVMYCSSDFVSGSEHDFERSVAQHIWKRKNAAVTSIDRPSVCAFQESCA